MAIADGEYPPPPPPVTHATTSSSHSNNPGGCIAGSTWLAMVQALLLPKFESCMLYAGVIVFLLLLWATVGHKVASRSVLP